MGTHEQFAEDLALHALNGLSGDERENLEKHLATCPACRLELGHLRADAALLAVSIEGAKPPQRARQRLLDSVAREPRSHSLSRHSWWGTLGWAAAAAVLVLVLSLWQENSALKQNLSALNLQLNHQNLELGRAGNVVATLTASDALRVTLVAAKTPPQPQGKAIYVRNRSSLIFLASNFPALPELKAYELWLIPVKGAPIPAGVFKPDAHGSSTVINPPLPQGVEAKAFAITVEPEAGSPEPTSPIVMMGSGE